MAVSCGLDERDTPGKGEVYPDYRSVILPRSNCANCGSFSGDTIPNSGSRCSKIQGVRILPA